MVITVIIVALIMETITMGDSVVTYLTSDTEAKIVIGSGLVAIWCFKTKSHFHQLKNGLRGVMYTAMSVGNKAIPVDNMLDQCVSK